MAETLILPGFEPFFSEPLPEGDAARITDLRQRYEAQLMVDRRETKQFYALKRAVALDERLSLARLSNPNTVIHTRLGFIHRKDTSLTVVDGQTVLSWTSRGERQQITGTTVEVVVNEFLHIPSRPTAKIS